MKMELPINHQNFLIAPTLDYQNWKFSGDHTDWQTFDDKFRAVIDETDIPVINKFSYLQSLLQGEAASAIAGLALTAENYVIAKDILRKRFGRPERIIFTHIQKLLETVWSLNSRDSSTPIDLWRLHDELQAKCEVFTTWASAVRRMV